MFKTFKLVAIVIIAAALAGCSRITPELRAREFIEALNSDDKARAESLMTKVARERMHSDDGKSLNLSNKGTDAHDRKWSNFEVGKAEINGEVAVVPIETHDGYKLETIKLKLRREDSDWRVFAIAFPIKTIGTELTLDFEHPESFVGDLLKVGFEEGGKALGKGMEALGQGLAKMGEGFARGLSSGASGKHL